MNPIRMRTPLKNVRHLGSAKEGAEHFWQQRLTGVANVVLALAATALIATLAGADYATVRATLAHPLVALLFLALAISGTIHMRLGMQVIIEDYVHAEGSKVLLVMLNTFFAILVGLACVYAVLKISFAG